MSVALIAGWALIVGCAGAGAVAGFFLFRLAGRDSRTLLPARWRPVLAWLTGVLCGLVAWRLGWSWELPAFLVLAVFGVLLGAIDLRTKLLPNALVLPFLGAAAALLAAAAWFTGNWSGLLGALLGAVVMFAVYLVLALISPGGLGMGDVKLAGVLGLYGGYAGMTPWLVTMMGGFILGSIAAVGLLVFTRSSGKQTFPYGPMMVAAALAAVLGAWG